MQFSSEMSHNRTAFEKYVSNLSNFSELIPILEQMPITSVKDIVIHQFEQLKADTAKSIIYSSLPIHEILPDDITQHILSFNKSSKVTIVNKKFKELSDRNTTNYLRDSYNLVNSKKSSPKNNAIKI